MEHNLRIRNPNYYVIQCTICLDHFCLVRHTECPDEECKKETQIRNLIKLKEEKRIRHLNKMRESALCNPIVSIK